MFLGANKVVPLPLWTNSTILVVGEAEIISGVKLKSSVCAKSNLTFWGFSSSLIFSTSNVPALLLSPIWTLVVPLPTLNVPAVSLPSSATNTLTVLVLELQSLAATRISAFFGYWSNEPLPVTEITVLVTSFGVSRSHPQKWGVGSVPSNSPITCPPLETYKLPLPKLPIFIGLLASLVTMSLLPCPSTTTVPLDRRWLAICNVPCIFTTEPPSILRLPSLPLPTWTKPLTVSGLTFPSVSGIPLLVPDQVTLAFAANGAVNRSNVNLLSLNFIVFSSRPFVVVCIIVDFITLRSCKQITNTYCKDL